MTQRHFRELAIALASSGASMATILAVAKVCESFNPRFKLDVFVQAAGGYGNVK